MISKDREEQTETQSVLLNLTYKRELGLNLHRANLSVN